MFFFRVALQEALDENEKLRKIIEDLKEENALFKQMLDEANSFVEVIKASIIHFIYLLLWYCVTSSICILTKQSTMTYLSLTHELFYIIINEHGKN